MTDKEDVPLVEDVVEVEEESNIVMGPKGKWSKGLCDCFDMFGTKPLWWMGWCFQCVLIGQLMQRMGLSWHASSSLDNKDSSKNTCKTVCTIGAVLLVFRALFEILRMQHGEQILGLMFTGYFIYVGARLRSIIRKEYEIPAKAFRECDGKVEDCCIITFCGCCSVIQMARQTHDENVHPYMAFSPTGLCLKAEAMVV